MNRKILAMVALGGTISLTLCLSGNGMARKKEISSTRHVVIDGRSFASEDSPMESGYLLKRELDRMCIPLPDGYRWPTDPLPPHPALEGLMKETPGAQSVQSPRPPAGCTAEHTLHMDGEGNPVDLVFGAMDSRGPSVRSRMISSGWRSVFSEKSAGGLQILHITTRKESTIVCLDEAEGTFLLLREDRR
jgi:hypothetical protein